ncbi:MAG TPA: hypothetical protein VLL05_18130 [Terriglobales bacterium]|nr:hypothetical protein [Terriglobales bacterium]
MSRTFSLWLLTLIGGSLLLDIAVHIWRRPTGFVGWDYLEPTVSAALIVTIWLA